MKEHICEKCEHEKECRNMVCFYELLEKEEEKIRADERAKHKYLIKADGSIHNLDEDIEKARADERAKVLDELSDIRDNLPFEYNNDFAWILAEYEKLNSHK